MTHTTPSNARYDPAVPALVIESLAITDPGVLSEARHWTAGRRGDAADPDELRTANLSEFVRQAMVVGAQAISTAGGVAERADIGALLSEVGERSAAASRAAAQATSQAAESAGIAIGLAAHAAKAAITEAGDTAHRAFMATLDSTRKGLTDEFTRTFGGDHPDLLVRLEPLLDRFSRDLEGRTVDHADAVLRKVTAQFDPMNPSSPMAQHIRAMAERQGELEVALSRGQRDLQTSVADLTTAVQVAHAATSARHATAQVTALKGRGVRDRDPWADERNRRRPWRRLRRNRCDGRPSIPEQEG